MQKSQFTDAQTVTILRRTEKGEQTIADVCSQHSVSENSFYRWRTRFSSATAIEAVRLRELGKKNLRLKRLLAERNLEADTSRISCKKDAEAADPLTEARH